MQVILRLVKALVLIVELLNSALEAIVDMVSPEFDEPARRAKDMGSAAVLLCPLVGAATILGYRTCRRYLLRTFRDNGLSSPPPR